MIKIDVERGLRARVTGKLRGKDSVVVHMTDEDALTPNSDAREFLAGGRERQRRPRDGYFLDMVTGDQTVLYEGLDMPTITQAASSLDAYSSLQFPIAGGMKPDGVGLENLVPQLQRHWKNRHPGKEFSESVIEGLPRAREVFDRDSRVRQRRTSI